MKALLAVLALVLSLASCAQTGCNGPAGDQCTDRSGAGSSAPGGRADGEPGSYGRY